MLLGYLEYARRTHKCTRKVWVGAGMWWVQDSEKYGRWMKMLVNNQTKITDNGKLTIA